MHQEGIVAGVSVLRQRERIAAFAIYGTMAISALVALGELLELSGVIDLVYAPDEPLALAYTTILFTSVVIFFASVVAVAMWIHRAHSNLHEAGLTGLQFTPGWAVGWYFIPIMFLFKPFQAMRELWTESHQTADRFSATAPGNLSTWWSFWIIGNIIGNVSARITLMGDGSNFQIATTLGLGSTICTIVSAWLLMGIIRQITAAQTDGIVAARIFE